MFGACLWRYPNSSHSLESTSRQADYYEGWGLHGRFILVESAVMDCLSEDKGLVAVREGYDRYRGDSWQILTSHDQQRYWTTTSNNDQQ